MSKTCLCCEKPLKKRANESCYSFEHRSYCCVKCAQDHVAKIKSGSFWSEEASLMLQRIVIRWLLDKRRSRIHSSDN